MVAAIRSRIMDSYHIPVLLQESIDELVKDIDGVYVDVTFGGGGHSQAILDRLSAKGRLMVFDQDGEAKENRMQDERLIFAPANFRFLYRYWKWSGLNKVDGILADLGVSSHQFDVDYRGFSYRYDAELDMRMNNEASLTAAKILSTYSRESLQSIFSRYGEIRNSKKLASAVVDRRDTMELLTTFQFNALLEGVIVGERNKYLALAYQALRIEVNQEMESLEEMLTASLKILKTNARFVAISYHSLEDRLIKRFLRSGKISGQVPKDDFGRSIAEMKQLGKLRLPTEEEQKLNPRSRSAKMRIGEKI